MKGVWHCNVCAFSICCECMEKTEALWQEKNLSEDEEENDWEDLWFRKDYWMISVIVWLFCRDFLIDCMGLICYSFIEFEIFMFL